jgi:ATP synthase F1 complex assembly factor 2
VLLLTLSSFISLSLFHCVQSHMCVTALDQAFPDRARFITHFENAMSADSVLLRVSSPSSLVQQQKRHLDPLLQFFKERYQCDLSTTLLFEKPGQVEAARKVQWSLIQSLSGWQLAALDSLCTVTKSFVISWSLLANRLSVASAFEASRVEENWQMRSFGKVEGVYGHGIDMEFARMSIAAGKTFFNLVTEEGNNPLLVATPTAHEQKRTTANA